jgi:hypothetical protein
MGHEVVRKGGMAERYGRIEEIGLSSLCMETMDID